MGGRLCVLALLAAAAPRPAPEAVTEAVIDLRLTQPDYFLPAPDGRAVLFKLDARQAPPKCRILFTTPRPAGMHRYRIEILRGRPDHTLTIATPVAGGRSVFEVSVAGQGRVDLGFWSPAPAPKEYRFTVTAPVQRRVFEVRMR